MKSSYCSFHSLSIKDFSLLMFPQMEKSLPRTSGKIERIFLYECEDHKVFFTKNFKAWKWGKRRRKWRRNLFINAINLFRSLTSSSTTLLCLVSPPSWFLSFFSIYSPRPFHRSWIISFKNASRIHTFLTADICSK